MYNKIFHFKILIKLLLVFDTLTDDSDNNELKQSLKLFTLCCFLFNVFMVFLPFLRIRNTYYDIIWIFVFSDINSFMSIGNRKYPLGKDLGHTYGFRHR